MRADARQSRVFVVDFEGDVQASAVDQLREEITAILSIAGSQDEVVVRLESPGGMVHSYGLAASQLSRTLAKMSNSRLRWTSCGERRLYDGLSRESSHCSTFCFIGFYWCGGANSEFQSV